MVKKDERTRMFSLMVKIRRVEERIMDVFAQGRIPGFIHVSIGRKAYP
jgi:TPP-dependent pyruvate/acetoin dehydrogenase alpha subunit